MFVNHLPDTFADHRKEFFCQHIRVHDLPLTAPYVMFFSADEE